MSRTYRFVRRDAGVQGIAEVTLRCATDADALLVGGRLGRRVEVWDGERRIGVVGADAPEDESADPAGRRSFNPLSPDAWRGVRRP
ncbi:MAG: hypothetical protein JO127_14545 [Caulobacteraceae bacterium]|nr:hypothetical protein [Caulobacteraceae bacterium]